VPNESTSLEIHNDTTFFLTYFLLSGHSGKVEAVNRNPLRVFQEPSLWVTVEDRLHLRRDQIAYAFCHNDAELPPQIALLAQEGVPYFQGKGYRYHFNLNTGKRVSLPSFFKLAPQHLNFDWLALEYGYINMSIVESVMCVDEEFDPGDQW